MQAFRGERKGEICESQAKCDRCARTMPRVVAVESDVLDHPSSQGNGIMCSQLISLPTPKTNTLETTLSLCRPLPESSRSVVGATTDRR